MHGQAVPSQSVVSSPAASPAASPTPTETAQPVAETPDTDLDPASLLPDLPALPKAKTTLIGGTVDRLDRVRDQVTVQVFGGGKIKIFFDTRTHVYRDGAAASFSDLRPGDRVYLDTILDGNMVFARNVRLKTTAAAGESQGTVMSYRRDKGELVLRDALSPQPLKILVSADTHVAYEDRSISASDLAPGTLVAVKFGSRQDGRDVAQQVSVLAVPGSSFTFAGQVTGLDLRTGVVVLTSSIDGKSYEIYLDPSVTAVDDSLRQAADVTIQTRFDGGRYVARSITVNSRGQQ